MHFVSANPERNIQQIRRFSQAVELLVADEGTSEIYGKISAQLARSGNPIPQNDIWIAALAIQSELALVTFDQHFQQVTGLKVIVW